MAGHYAPDAGRAMEDGFSELLERIGYRIKRKRDQKSGLDIVADFDGEPLPVLNNRCYLKKPIFSPDGVTAFSLKRGDITKADVEELIDKTKKAKNLDDPIMKKLSGSVIVTNYTKTELQLNELLDKSVYCWDIRRLIFYSTKAKECLERASRGPVREQSLEGVQKTSALIETGEKIGSGAITVSIVIFVDNHDRDQSVDSNYINSILSEVYEKSLKPYVDSTDLDVQALYRFHLLGIADEDLLRKTYTDYARHDSHPRVTFSATPTVFQYGATPWRGLFQF